MIPDLKFNPKFQLLEENDLIEEGDEWYDPITDTWRLVDSTEEEDAAIGFEWSQWEYKPMRRKNPTQQQASVGKSEWTNTPLERPTRLGYGSNFIDSAVEEAMLARDWKEDPQHPCDFD